MKAVVTDANNRVALSVTRALGSAGVRVDVTEQRRFAGTVPLAARSRFATRLHVIPDLREPRRFVEDLAAACETADVLIPVATNTVLAVARAPERFRAATLLPHAETLYCANDKEWLMEFARGIGVAVPETLKPAGPDGLVDAARRLGYPLVMKLRNDEGLFVTPEQRYGIVANDAEMLRAYEALNALKPAPLVQKFIRGDAYGFSAVFDRQSRPVAFLCHRRIREYPASGGPSSMCESVHDRELIETGLKLLTELSWQGAAMVEFKKDSSTGKFVLMEVNPRFWGSLPLAIAAGVNFPHLLCRAALGERIEPVTRWKLGCRLRFFFADAAGFFSVARTAGLGDPRAKGFIRDLFDPSVKDGIFELSDPLPALTYVLNRMKR